VPLGDRVEQAQASLAARRDRRGVLEELLEGGGRLIRFAQRGGELGGVVVLELGLGLGLGLCESERTLGRADLQ
jgi:hypothetical protein